MFFNREGVERVKVNLEEGEKFIGLEKGKFREGFSYFRWWIGKVREGLVESILVYVFNNII